MSQDPNTNQEDDSLAGRLNMTAFRKHYVAAMTADEEAWPQRERSGNLGRVFVIILLLHVFVIGAVVLYNIVAPKNSPIVTSETKPILAKNGSSTSTVAKPGTPQNTAASATPGKPDSAASAAGGKPEDETGTYEVKTGDNLPGIASTLGVDAQELVKFNDLENTNLYPGRKITYPKNTAAKASAIAPAGTASLPKLQKPMVLAQNTSADKKNNPPAKDSSATSKADEVPKATLIKKPDSADSPPATIHSKKDESSTPPPAKPKTETKNEPAKPAKGATKTEKTDKPARDTAGKRTYVTTSKDTLYSIARKYGVKIEALMKANNIKDPTMLRDGTKLIIPSKN